MLGNPTLYAAWSGELDRKETRAEDHGIARKDDVSAAFKHAEEQIERQSSSACIEAHKAAATIKPEYLINHRDMDKGVVTLHPPHESSLLLQFDFRSKEAQIVIGEQIAYRTAFYVSQGHSFPSAVGGVIAEYIDIQRNKIKEQEERKKPEHSAQKMPKNREDSER